MIDNLAKKIEKLIWSDYLQHFGRLGALASTILRYLYGMLRDMLSGQLTLHAMSLVYTTLLSIVPLLGISFAMAKGLGVFDKLRENLDTFLVHLGPDAERISSQLFDMVDKVNGSVIGGIGVAFFLWTAISTVQKVESSFNYVWYVSKPRNFARRFTEYLVVLPIGPVVIATAFTMLGAYGIAQLLVGLGTMLADIADEHELATRRRQEGIFFGAFSFTNKSSAALGSLIGGVVLDLIHWPTGAAVRTAADVPWDTLVSLGLIWGPFSAVLALPGLWCMTRYRLDRAAHSRVLERLAEREHLVAHRLELTALSRELEKSAGIDYREGFLLHTTVRSTTRRPPRPERDPRRGPQLRDFSSRRT